MTHFNLTTPNLTAWNFVPGTSATPATIWLDARHKLTVCPLPNFIRKRPLSWSCLDRIRRVSSWRYMDLRG